MCYLRNYGTHFYVKQILAGEIKFCCAVTVTHTVCEIDICLIVLVRICIHHKISSRVTS